MGDPRASRAAFRLLGPVSVWHNDSPLALGGPRHRRLLAMLLLNADHVVSTGRLIGALWGDEPPASAPAMVHVRISELRSLLRPVRPDDDAGVANEAGGYVLRLGDDELDCHRFTQLATDGLAALRRRDAVAALTHLAAGLALWRGPALGEFHDEAFAADSVARLESLWREAWEARIQAELHQGRHAEVIGELEAAVRDHPLREPLWCHLMTALYRSGRQSDALAAYGRARTQLAEQLGLDPGPQLRALHRALLNQDPRLLGPAPITGPPADPTGGNVPTPLTTFVGRARDLTDVVSAVRESRLVSVTGAGGVGKSRLAIEVGLRCRPDFPGGVWMVELAALQQPGLVARALATTLGLREHGQRETTQLLTDHLADTAALIVLDNCEHVLAEAAEVVNELLSACARLRVLTTTRERLGVDGEVLRPLTGLAVPGSELTDPAMIRQFDAVRLFEDRARAARPDFVLTGATAAAAADVCRQLDGLPLAIELAGARANAMSVADIAVRLDDRFRLLRRGAGNVVPRHETLRAAVDWSFDLLSPPEQNLFTRLSAFVGGFTLAAAEDLGADTDLLVQLVDKSLVVMTESGAGPQRYRLLETMRAYGWERLAESSSANAVCDRHANYYLDLVKNARSVLFGPGQAAQLRLLESELGNIRAALTWFLRSGHAESALRLAGWLYPLWDRHGHYREGRRWLTQALALDEAAPQRARARALDSAAGLALIQGDHETAAAEADQAATVCREIGDGAGLAQALTTRGLAGIYADSIPDATEMLQEALRLARQAGDHHAEATSMVYLTTAFLAGEDQDRTRRLSNEAAAVFDRIGDPEGLAWTRVLRGAAAWRQGHRDEARRSLRPGILGFSDLGHVVGLSVGVFVGAQLAAGPSWEDAIVLMAASEALRESVGAALLPFARPWLIEFTARATALIGESAVDRLWRTGSALPMADVVHRAIEQL
jgi:predicted ATPase/DNA-binding SARP family transcriptional activator